MSELALTPHEVLREHPIHHKRIKIMREKLLTGLTLLALVAAAPLLSGCHTTAGVGQDLSAGGNAVTNSAEKHTP